MFLSSFSPRSTNVFFDPVAHLPIGVLGKTDRARIGDAFQSRGDIDAVAHQVAVALLDDVAEMNADAELDAPVGGQADVALDHRVLHLDGAAHGIDHAAELDQRPVAGALEHAPVMDGDRGVDEFRAQRPQPRQCPVLVGARHPAEADDIGGQDCCDFPGLGHRAPHTRCTITQRPSGCYGSIPAVRRRGNNACDFLH